MKTHKPRKGLVRNSLQVVQEATFIRVGQNPVARALYKKHEPLEAYQASSASQTAKPEHCLPRPVVSRKPRHLLKSLHYWTQSTH